MAIADLLSEGVSTKHAGRLFERKLIRGDAEDIRKCWRLRITEAGRRALERQAEIRRDQGGEA